MGKVFLQRGNGTGSGIKKAVYKYVDGIRTQRFADAPSAAIDAGVSSSAMVSYAKNNHKKPKKIPENVEYNYSSRFIKSDEYFIE